MLPSTNYFKTYYCPFYQSGLCTRPYCHYKDEKKVTVPKKPPEPQPQQQQPTASCYASSSSATVSSIPGFDSRKRALERDEVEDKPTYCPTPLAVLAKVTQPPRLSSYVPTKITRMNELPFPPLPVKKKLKKAPESKDVLGNIDDLSDDEESEYAEGTSQEGNDRPDLIASILLDGKKSGVFGSNVDEFELDVMRNKIKLQRDKAKAKQKALEAANKTAEEEEEVCQKDDVTLSQKVSSDLGSLSVSETKEEEVVTSSPAVNNTAKVLEEIAMIEEKRQLLENYFRGKNMLGPSKCGDDKDTNLEREKRRTDEKRQSSDKESHRDRKTSDNSERHRHSSTEDRQHRSSHNKHSKRDKERDEKKNKDSKHREREKDSKNSDKDRKHGDREKDSKKSDRDKKDGHSEKDRKRSSDRDKEKREDKDSRSSDRKKHKDRDRDRDRERRKEKEKKKAESQTESPPSDDDVLSFLELMSELDKKVENDFGSKNKKKGSDDSEDQENERKMRRRESEESKSYHRSTSNQSEKSNQDDKRSHKHREESQKYHRSTSSKSQKDDGRRNSEESSKRHPRTSSSSRSEQSSSHHRSDKMFSPSQKDRCQSPIPDLSEELDLLPTDLDDFNGLEHQEEEYAQSNDDDDNDDVGEENGDNDDEDEEEEEEEEQLKRIFEAYNPDPSTENASLRKAKKLEEDKREMDDDAAGASQQHANAKKRVAHFAAVEEGRKNVRRPVSNPSRMMMDRFRKIQQIHKENDLENQMARVMEGREPPPMAASGVTTTRISGSSKMKSRVAHAPSASQATYLNRPMVEVDSQAKVPSNIRQRYLTSITDECLKIYHNNKEAAYKRAIAEEKQCYARSKSRTIYLNVVVNAIKKLRGEASLAAKEAVPGTSSGAARDLTKPGGGLLTTHLQVLAGKPGTVGTWSFEKKTPHELEAENISEDVFTSLLKRYIMTKDQLEENGYPVEDPDVVGGAKITAKPFFKNNGPQPKDPYKRRCDRCSKIYDIDEDAHQIDREEPCVYHYGRNFTTRGNRATGHVSLYNCCNSDSSSEGCQVHPLHVSDVMELKGFVSTKDPGDEIDSSRVYALDCEMCSTTFGNELARVTVIDFEGKTIYESLVKPENDIIDYNTRFSGISAEDLDGVTTTIRDVQAVLLTIFSAKTILLGHSLESDLKALKILHHYVVDTSVVFPHKMGPPYKRALRNLASDHLKRIIQNDVGGHDSAEDALTCLDLMKVKVKEDIKKMIQMAKKQKAAEN